MTRTRPRRKQIPPGERPSMLPPCTWTAGDPATAPGPDQRPACGTCGLPYVHVRHHHEPDQAALDAQAEHRRRTGEREE